MEEKHKCPVCGLYEFEEINSYDVCEICGWEDDDLQEKRPDYEGGANRMSLNEAREAYKNGLQIWKILKLQRFERNFKALFLCQKGEEPNGRPGHARVQLRAVGGAGE